MARIALIQKESKRRELTDKYKEKRKLLKSIIKSSNSSINEKTAACFALQKLPRDSSAVRMRNRCMRDGRPRGTLREFRVSRIFFRELALAGYLPGVMKHSNK